MPWPSDRQLSAHFLAQFCLQVIAAVHQVVFAALIQTPWIHECHCRHFLCLLSSLGDGYHKLHHWLFFVKSCSKVLWYLDGHVKVSRRIFLFRLFSRPIINHNHVKILGLIIIMHQISSIINYKSNILLMIWLSLGVLRNLNYSPKLIISLHKNPSL